ncbi:MAG: glycoside hydrolase family 25 protein [Rhizobiaceae bacterium]
MANRFFIILLSLCLLASPAQAAEFFAPWGQKNRAIVIDAYEFNPIDWTKMLKDKRIAAFIGKATDGMPPRYRCKADKKSLVYKYCTLAWRKYTVTKELYHSRRLIAKSHGLKWGAYHLGRPGKPVEQADHFIEFADPQKDEMIVIDVEDVESGDFISLEHAELFAKRIKQRLGRYPVLYTNTITLRKIAMKYAELPILSRLKVWYPRYKPSIAGVFPMGNWKSYLLWQFSYGGNCSKKKCPYRLKGTARNIDVNVMNKTVKALKAGWPFDGLVPDVIGPGELIYIPYPSEWDDYGP